MADSKKIGDPPLNLRRAGAKLAQRVIEAYADLDGFTADECKGLGIDPAHCDVLQNVLGSGRDGFVSDDERKKLAASGFSDEFIKGLAGDFGYRALNERVKWIADRAVKRFWRTRAYEYDRPDMIYWLGKVGPVAAPAVPVLIEALEDGNEAVRHAAVWALGEIGPFAAPAVPLLIKALKSGDHEMRAQAVRSLGRIGPASQDVVPALIAVLWGGRHGNLKGSDVLEALGRIGVPAVPALVAKLKDKDPFMRMWAAVALGKVGSVAVPALIAALGDSDWMARAYAARALGKIGPGAAAAVPSLTKALGDKGRGSESHLEAMDDIARHETAYERMKLMNDFPDMVTTWGNNVAASAAEALGDIGPDARSAVPDLIKAMEMETVGGPAVLALGKIGADAKAAVPVFARELHSKGRLRGVVAQAVCGMGEAAEEALPYLIDHYADDLNFWYKTPGLNEVAVAEIVKCGRPIVRHLIVALTSHKDPPRSFAADCLEALGPEAVSAVPALVGGLGDDDKWLRIRSAQVLGSIGKAAHHALPFLEPMSESDPDPDCRKAAAEAVEKILKDVR